MAAIEANASIGHLKNIYNQYRSALLNKKYYGCRLESTRRTNLVVEIMIAVGASGSTGIAGLTIWQQGAGITAWALISGIAILLSTIKPFLGLAAQIERYGKLWGEFASMYEAFKIIEQDCRANDYLTTEQVDTFKRLRERIQNLAPLDDQRPDKKLIKRLTQEVNHELPVTMLWKPKIAPIANAAA
jgi:hypothetical protein